MDTSTITNPEAQAFINQFLRDRAVNRKFYELVPEDKYDYRMVDTPSRKSDSVRESITHQIDTERDYLNAAKTGEMKFGVTYEDLSNSLPKDRLLTLLQESDNQLIEILSAEDIGTKKVKVPWSSEPVPAISSLWALDSHEILHQGWNLAVMDHLNIERFAELKEMWG